MVEILFNIQVVVDVKYNFVVVIYIINKNDCSVLLVIVIEVKENLGIEIYIVLVDKGYYNGK